jgi:hypothetical protein
MQENKALATAEYYRASSAQSRRHRASRTGLNPCVGFPVIHRSRNASHGLLDPLIEGKCSLLLEWWTNLPLEKDSASGDYNKPYGIFPFVCNHGIKRTRDIPTQRRGVPYGQGHGP